MDPIGFIHETTWSDLPDQVRNQARRCLLDTVGAGLAGRRTELSGIVHEFAATTFGGTGARLWLDGRTVSPPGAALANGMTIDALDIHDGYLLVKGHVGAAVVPAVLAAVPIEGDPPLTGQDLLTALVVGYEVALRAGLALHATACDYHTSGAWNALGCAAAVARLRGLDAARTRHALGIAEYHGPRSQMMRCIDHPTMVKDGSGWGAMAGVSAALLAGGGFTGAPAVTVEAPAVADYWADLGERWRIVEQFFKPYAVCRWAQPAIAGALALQRSGALAPEAITRIRVTTFHEATRLAVRRPETTEEAQYSLPFPVAAALVHGRLGLAELTGAGLRDPAVGRLADLVELVEEPTHSARFPVERIARVRIETADGAVFDSGDAEAPWGEDAAPTDEELDEKFRWLAGESVSPARAVDLAEMIWGCADLADAGRLVALTGATGGFPTAIDVNLWRFLDDHVERSPDKTLLRFRDERYDYADVHARSLRAARALHDLGVVAGDNVCLMLGNRPEYLFVWFALARLGAVKVPINVHLKGDGLTYILAHADAELLIIEDDLVGRVLPLRDHIPRLRTIVVVGDDPDPPAGCPRWTDLLAGADGPCPDAAPPPETVAAILYTSGTTGPPKGAMLSHRAYLNSARAFAEEFVEATAEDVLYTCLPLFHINAQAHTVLPAIGRNATMALGERFSASGFWAEIRRHEATIFNSLAAMIPILCKQPPGPDDRAHRARLTACAATPKDLWREFEERFGVRIVEGYGLTETAGFCVCNPPTAIRLGSMGRPMSFVEARVVDEEDREAPPGQRGEIALRSWTPHAFMEGYFKMPAATEAAVRGGWFHSGDLGDADADGYLHFVDRLKQCIRRRGENISSWEVEQVVNAHPSVLESAVVGVPSELGEEDVLVCVVSRPGLTVEPVELVRWCEERLAYFMVPRYVAVRQTLPKTATERVEKYRLKQEGIAGAWDRESAGYRLRRG